MVQGRGYCLGLMLCVPTIGNRRVTTVPPRAPGCVPRGEEYGAGVGWSRGDIATCHLGRVLVGVADVNVQECLGHGSHSTSPFWSRPTRSPAGARKMVVITHA
jgi:hypothetical protein